MTDTPLIKAMMRPETYPHPVDKISLVETHISWLFLTGEFVYKIKKPVDLGFLDFSSLAKRQHFCRQELLLNQRLAPEIYLEVVSLNGAAENPSLNGPGDVIDYAIKMRQFDPQQQLDCLSDRGELSNTHIDELADTIAQFHQGCEVASTNQPFGEPTAIWHPVQENFDQISALLNDDVAQAQLDKLFHWSQAKFSEVKPVLVQRKQQGHVRNCHGDMHLANITLFENHILIFDCIEFNDEFRWIDTISDLAFCYMDLIDRQQTALAHRLLDRYLQRSGDYEGLSLLAFYCVYRALVRAKVAIIRSSQAGLDAQQKQACLDEYRQYQQLAERFTQSHSPTLFIAHGVSGSGKTVLTQPLLEQFGMIRLRSDVERKRLFGLPAEARSGSGTDTGIYQANASQRTYGRLAEIAATLLTAGFSTIVDATFLKHSQRQQFKTLAQSCGCRFVILHFHARPELLRQWINERQAAGQDASEATVEVLEQQLRHEEPLNNDEADHIIAIDSEKLDADQGLIQAVADLYSD